MDSAESEPSGFTRPELLLLDLAAQNYIAHLRKRHGRRRRSPEAVRALVALEATAASAAQKVRDLAKRAAVAEPEIQTETRPKET